MPPWRSRSTTRFPREDKAEFQLDWTSQTLFDEIYGHAFLNRLSGGIGAFGDIHERSNPINIVFADYGGPGCDDH